jgi:amidohydrolase
METALTLAQRTDLNCTVRVIGTPAEEVFAGKAPMLEAGAFDGVDAAFTYHPSDVLAVFGTLNGAALFELAFEGRASHAASRPWDGRSALDGASLAMHALAMERQYHRDGCRIHATVQSTTGSHNVLPDGSVLLVNVRAPQDTLLERLIESVHRIAEGSAQATGTSVRARLVSKARPYRMHDGLARLGWEVMGIPHGTTYDISGSSDLGDVSQEVPTVCITETGWSPVTWHSRDLHDAAGTDGAYASMHRAAATLVSMIERFIASPQRWLKADDTSSAGATVESRNDTPNA